MSTDLIEFYLGAGPDHRGRLITEIWDWLAGRRTGAHTRLRILKSLSELGLEQEA